MGKVIHGHIWINEGEATTRGQIGFHKVQQSISSSPVQLFTPGDTGGTVSLKMTLIEINYLYFSVRPERQRKLGYLIGDETKAFSLDSASRYAQKLACVFRKMTDNMKQRRPSSLEGKVTNVRMYEVWRSVFPVRCPLGELRLRDQAERALKKILNPIWEENGQRTKNSCYRHLLSVHFDFDSPLLSTHLRSMQISLALSITSYWPSSIDCPPLMKRDWSAVHIHVLLCAKYHKQCTRKLFVIVCMQPRVELAQKLELHRCLSVLPRKRN